MHDHAPFAYHKQVLTYAFTADQSARRGWRFSHMEAANGTDIKFDDGRYKTISALNACALNA